MLAGRTAASGTRAERVPQRSWPARAVEWALADAYRLGIGVIAAALATFLLFRMTVWPPHEDETLVYFVTRQPIGDMFTTVFSERGGAPLHWLLAYLVTSISPTLTALRLISVVFAVASIPVIAALVARLSDRRTALVATALAAASWIVIYHGIYARMYSLFLFLSALSFLTLLRALEGRGRGRWAAWIVSTVLMIATQPYGALVLAAQGVYVAALVWRRGLTLRPAAISLAVVLVLAAPLWLSYRVLASRFGIGLTGTSGSELGSPADVVEYVWQTFGDFSAGWTAAAAIFGTLAIGGGVVLARVRPFALLLAVSVVVLPAVALVVTRSQTILFLESRHLIFALPFFQMLVAAGVIKLTSLAGRTQAVAVLVALTALLGVEVAWGLHKTPYMYAGEPAVRKEARAEAASWLAATSRPNDVLFGYEPLYLDAVEKGAPFGSVIVQRADPRLAIDSLDEAKKPLGRGVWVFDATDQTDPSLARLTIPNASPGPAFEAHAWGPFLVIRTKEPVGDAGTFFRDTAAVEVLGRTLGIADASINLQTAVTARSRLESGG
jgi:hypothetical protein